MRTAAALRREAEVTEALAHVISRADMRDQMLRLAGDIRQQAEAAELRERGAEAVDPCEGLRL